MASFALATRTRFATRRSFRFSLALVSSVIVLPPQNVPTAFARPAGLALELSGPRDLIEGSSASLHIKVDDLDALDAPSQQQPLQQNLHQPFGGLALEAFDDFSQAGVLRYGDSLIRLPYDEANDVYAFGPMRLKRELVATIVRAAFVAGVDPRLLMAIADKESSFVVKARASTSSATGLFQFIDATWLKALRDFGGQFALESEALSAATLISAQGEEAQTPAAARTRLLALRNDPFLSTLMAAAMLRHEQEKLESKFGRQISGAEVYLVHFLGPAGAQKFLAALEDTPDAAASQLLPAAARANRPIFFEARWVQAKSRAKAASAKRASLKTGAKFKLVAQSLSVAQVHGKIEVSLERRLSRYRALDFGSAPLDVWSGEARSNYSFNEAAASERNDL